ncbi:MAG: pyridoxal phosphate-dependent aminotransferase [Planctomycetota bacterium]|nr:MAG: pyridoxal phosphate-dependent aminotransferase [Planctomycetota bacterium]
MKLARRVMELTESATLAVSAKAARMKAAGVDVIGFGAGEPDFDTPEPIKQAGIEAIRGGHTHYSKPASGLVEAKSAVCAKFARDNGLSYTPAEVIVTAGGKMACYLAIQAVVDPGDEVVIPRPYWVSYPEMVKLAGGTPIFVTGPEENDYKLTPAVLESVLTDRTRMVILCSPSNPSGVTYSPDELRVVADVLAGRDLVVLSDEIYDRLIYDGVEHLSFAAIDDRTRAKTVTVNAASKTYAMTGWRVGFAGGPAEIIKAMARLQSQTTSGAVTFNQHALTAALTGDQFVVETMRQAFRERAERMYRRLTAIPGVRCPRPTGAIYCFPNVSATYDRLGVSGSVEFADRLLEEIRVAVVPGIAFGLDAHVRLSFALSLEEMDEGLSRIEAFLR